MEESRGRTLDTLAIAAIVAVWAETLVTLPGLPDMVPMSFGNDGTPHSFGAKLTFLMLPALKTIAVNVPFEISAQRLAALMPLHRFVQRLVRVEVLIGFLALQLSLLESARIEHLPSRT